MFKPASPEQAMLRQQFLESKETTAWLRFSMAGCATIAVYDTIITLSDEIELVWKRNLWTFPALLYFGNRYVTLATVLLTSYTVSPFHSSSSDAV
ncbi:hypothetical protein FRC19_007079 [Serendipita sp. 401]|nr:hypothetical protein FRC19_007079 [Serendipita sp. 401]KAG9025831.1 hypothetical protein FS842_005185 [Serendipita sp. 407]